MDSGVVVEEEDSMASIMEKAPEIYPSVLAVEERVKGGGFPLSHIEQAMSSQYIIVSGRKTKKEGNE